MESYNHYSCDPPDTHGSRYSHSKKKAPRKRSKSLNKEKSKEKFNNSSKKESHTKKLSASGTSSLANTSPPLKTAKPGSPYTKANSTTKLPVPPVPTTEQLQSAVLRPVQPRPRSYTVETAQTVSIKGNYSPRKNLPPVSYAI
ncbi:hypothetical protein ACTXT7_002900 [Hymenolepis weldensis]